MVGDAYTVVLQFCLQVMVERLEVHPLLKGFLRCRIEDVHHHLVEQRLLVDVAVSHNFLHRLIGLCERVLVVSHDEHLGHGCRLHLRSLHVERREACPGVSHAPVRLVGDGVAIGSVGGVTATALPACLVDVHLKVFQRLVEFQVARGLV